MAAPATLPALLDSLTQSLSSAQDVAPKLSSLEQPKDGISLLDVKNELLLSYLQNLVFLILLKLRNAKNTSTGEDGEDITEDVRRKLVELRLYLEKGARPLEEKLKFSIERFLRTAQDSQRKEQQQKKLNGKDGDSESGSGSESEEESEDSDNELRPSAKGKGKASVPGLSTMRDEIKIKSGGDDKAPGGVYRPPKRERQVMDGAAGNTTTTTRREKNERRGGKSHTMDEFIADELSAAPAAEPSIGTTIVQGGRKMKTAQDRASEAERQVYEESNFVRLPKESKKDKAKKNREAGRSSRMQFGGEDWHDLGQGVDRIDRLTRRKEKGGGGVRAMLEKSRKRGPETTDGPRGSGEMGERFQKRVKLLETGRRDRGKGRK